MTLDFSELGEVKINMIPYIEDIVKDFAKHDENMKKSATPESYQLLKTREDAIILEDTQEKIYNNCFSKALFSTNK